MSPRSGYTSSDTNAQVNFSLALQRRSSFVTQPMVWEDYQSRYESVGCFALSVFVVLSTSWFAVCCPNEVSTCNKQGPIGCLICSWVQPIPLCNICSMLNLLANFLDRIANAVWHATRPNWSFDQRGSGSAHSKYGSWDLRLRDEWPPHVKLGGTGCGDLMSLSADE